MSVADRQYEDITESINYLEGLRRDPSQLEHFDIYEHVVFIEHYFSFVEHNNMVDDRYWKLFSYQSKLYTTAYNDFHNEPKDKSGVVYLIKGAGLHKIGFTTINAMARTAQHQTGSPVPLTLVHTFSTDNVQKSEKTLHDMFDDKRKHGEWFELTQADVDYICAIESLNAEDIA